MKKKKKKKEEEEEEKEEEEEEEDPSITYNHLKYLNMNDARIVRKIKPSQADCLNIRVIIDINRHA